MSQPISTDPNTLAAIVTGLGATVVPAESFQFDLAMRDAERVVPRLNELGLGVRRVSERVEPDPIRPSAIISVVRCELYRPQPKPERLAERY